ncbi:MAG: GNAT family N-acetyltransferase [Deltaproteobacteria bacterium]|nr:GNAT family N-acetyltransferase [Deltaproteobacteria bacterium]
MIHAPAVITTDRLVLRRPALTDAADVYAYAHDPEVTRHLVWPTHTEIKESIAFLETCDPRWEAGDEYCWVITIAPEDRVVGSIGCRVREYTADFGYVLHRAYWGHGYATEAAQAVVTWLRSLPGICRISATCDVDNLASVRVLEKSGLSCEGRLRRSTIRPNLSSTPRDTFVFAWVQDEGVKP